MLKAPVVQRKRGSVKVYLRFYSQFCLVHSCSSPLTICHLLGSWASTFAVTCPFLWHILRRSSVTVKWGSPRLVSLLSQLHFICWRSAGKRRREEQKKTVNESWKVIKKWIDPAAGIVATLPMSPGAVCNLQIDTMLHFSCACHSPLIVQTFTAPRACRTSDKAHVFMH